MEKTLLSRLEWFLRIGVFLTFLGHGVFAFSGNTYWLPYLTIFGFSEDIALQLMSIIGVVDILVAISILLKPYKIVVLYALLWAFTTALMRLISGESIWSFIERGANWIVPLCLYLVLSYKTRN